MPTYKVIFPAIAIVNADNIDEAKKLGVYRAGFDYFTTYTIDDVIAIEVTTKYKPCPKCKFYCTLTTNEVCHYCKGK